MMSETFRELVLMGCMVVVLHGGLGNAQCIASQRSESALNMNAVAEQGGFLGPFVIPCGT
jgi:poly(3-hydroxybutyrate) depolymerase